ncbi:A24 family peptidase [Thalassotalea litorea]|uniref:A24 family peptidase n=1 Tax=Thalassotalea litorea TaxID=2020715 RepID=UPI0037367D14
MFDYYVIMMLVLTFLAFIIALYTDIHTQKIPNSLCLSLLMLGVCLQAYFHGWHGILLGMGGFLVALATLFPAFMFRLLGAGDVKLMLALGVFAGPGLILWAIGYGIAFGLITSILIGLFKQGWSGLKATLKRYYYCFYTREYLVPQNNELAGTQVPYAPALALGWFWALSKNHDVMWVISSVRYSLGF